MRLNECFFSSLLPFKYNLHLREHTHNKNKPLFHSEGGIAASSVAESFSTVTRGGDRGIGVSFSLFACASSLPLALFRRLLLLQNSTGTSIAKADSHSVFASMSLTSSSTFRNFDPGKKAPRASAARTFSSSPWQRGQFCLE